MIYKIYKTLQFLQIIATTVVGFLLFDIKGMIVGFIIGVMIAGHFLTLLGARQINTDNAKMLKELLEETRKMQHRLNENLPQTTEPPKS
jgi:uncharacterized membrane protein